MLSIIVLSSDGYSDCWDPLFFSLKKYFPGIEKHEIILSTNTKKFQYSGLDIICLTNGIDTPWSKRLKNSLAKAKNEIVLVMVEDFVLRSEINPRIFKEFLLLMKDSNKVDHIRFLAMLNRISLNSSEYSNLDEIDYKSKLRFTYLPGLWKKNILLKYVKNNESPFMSERFGNIRSRIYKDGFYCVSKRFIESNGQFYDCEPSGVIFKGKWPRWVVPLFEKEGIKMDFSIRGMVTKEFRKNARRNSKLEMVKNPISTSKSLISISVLYLNSFFSSIKK